MIPSNFSRSRETYRRFNTTQTAVADSGSLGNLQKLADRVIAMTALPGRLKDDVEIKLPWPRDPTSPSFNDYRRELENLMRDEITVDATAGSA